MILQELCKLYDRLKDDSAYEIPKPGYSLQKISFIVVLKPDGTLFDIQDARVQNGKKLAPREILVPGGAHPTSTKPTPRLLWDSPVYIFGYDKDPKKNARAKELFSAYQNYHSTLAESISSPALVAVATFLKQWNPDEAPDSLKSKIEAFGTNFGLFQILGETRFVHQMPEVESYFERQRPGENTETQQLGMCLITGEINSPIARLIEPGIKLGSNPGGCKITAFKPPAFDSYGKTQAYNSPISEKASFKSCNALNTLIASQKHRFRLGDSTVVFWTGERNEGESIENDFSALLDTPSSQNQTKLRHIETFLKNLRNSDTPQTALEQSGYSDSAETPFFMLGLSPNAARLAIRFWHAGTLGRFLEHLREHHRAMQMQRRNEKFNDPEFIPLWQILRQTARESDGIPPLLGGALLRSIVENLPYPQSMIQLVLNRIRVDGEINYVRASILKAFLTRNKKQQIPMSLDTNNTNPAYLLGRLFAVLEKTQIEAIPGLNSGIRERFYASASSTPRTVFPIMLRTFPHHLAKLDKPKEIFFSKLAQQILDGINPGNGFPAHLNLESQGLFAIGYYQQTQAFFTKKESSENAPSK